MRNVVGLLSGWFALKVNSTMWGIVAGSVLGLGFAFAVAAMPSETGHHYLEIMAPGFVVGAIIGFLTQKMGTPAAVKRSI
jgi:F0F1-type ATP synthase assembly protein I